MVPVSVNVSRADFEIPDLAEKIKNLVEKYEIEPELLHLEVTETAYTENPHKIIKIVSELRRFGFKMEMDDFGSGYSSLNMLSELPIDILKLDMKFIQQRRSSQKKSILSFIIALAKWMNLDTVAEGVENEEQISHLKAIGCQYVQGYFYARPMKLQEFDTYLDQHFPKPASGARSDQDCGVATELDKAENRLNKLDEENELLRKMREIEHRAATDGLTGLYNRTEFEMRITEAFHSSPNFQKRI